MRARIVVWILLGLTASSSVRAEARVPARARAAYARGKALYQKRAYAEAIVEFERAYKLSRAPALLFNLAQAHRLAGPEHCRVALELYQQYSANDPRASNRVESNERIDEMRACVEEQDQKSASEPVTEPTPVQTPEPRPSPRVQSASPAPISKKAAPQAPARSQPAPASTSASPPMSALLLTGAGATLLLAGTILYVRARTKYDDAKASCPCPEGSYSNWQTLTNVSYGLLATGAAASAGGVALWLVSTDDPGKRPQGLVLHTSVRF